MKIKKGDKLVVDCVRRGVYNAVATVDFDTEIDEWFGVALDQETAIVGRSEVWWRGDDIPCRRGQARISPRTRPAQKGS